MGKHLVYITGAFTIIIIICSIVMVTMDKSSYNDEKVPNNIQSINDISIDKDNITVTTDIWDYIRSHNESTIGDSSNNHIDSEPKLTIVLK